jgi:glycosyltransferase involved in cell wall biosynthesis
MRIAFIGHSYHRETGSSKFFQKMLSRLGDVHCFFDATWKNARNEWAKNFKESDFDCIVIWQAHIAFRYLSGELPNVVFIPMYDAMMDWGRFYWSRAFNVAKILCFSFALYQEVQRHSKYAKYVQYYPDPNSYRAVTDYSSLRAFFWKRVLRIDEEVLGSLSQGTHFDVFTVHDAPDPGTPRRSKSSIDVSCRELRRTEWFPAREEYVRCLGEHNVFFAGRAREGLGMSLLEAMAMGMCVVAPNSGTHNEYISDGTNGRLYNLNCPVPIDLAGFQQLGQRARESVVRGYQRWEARVAEVLDFLVTPTKKVTRGQIAIDGWLDRARAAGSEKTTKVAARKNPKISVVTVCLNTAGDIEKTIRSVVAQDYPSAEYVILDGGSSDGTQDVIRSYADRIAYWGSRSDKGPYHAMKESLDHIRGEWVIFMNAGDFFVSEDALSRMFAHVPSETSVVYGHHIYRRQDGIDEFHRARDFERTWGRLKAGLLDHDWLRGIPGHQATAVRAQLLRRLGFDPALGIAADHDLLFRAWLEGAKFFNADELVSVYIGGGLSARQYERCKREWALVASRYGDSEAAMVFYRRFGAPWGYGPLSRYDLVPDRILSSVKELVKRLPGVGWAARWAYHMFHLKRVEVMMIKRYLALIRGVASVLTAWDKKVFKIRRGT